MMLEHAEKLLYVGISRARFQLALIADLSEEECGELLDQMDMRRTKRPKKPLPLHITPSLHHSRKRSLKRTETHIISKTASLFGEAVLLVPYMVMLSNLL